METVTLFFPRVGASNDETIHLGSQFNWEQSPVKLDMIIPCEVWFVRISTFMFWLDMGEQLIVEVL